MGWWCFSGVFRKGDSVLRKDVMSVRQTMRLRHVGGALGEQEFTVERVMWRERSMAPYFTSFARFLGVRENLLDW